MAVVVLPTFQNDINEKLFENSKKIFKSKLEEGLHRMRIQGDLAEIYPTTSDFVAALSKYITIAQVCNSNNLTSCFPEQIKNTPSTVKYYTANITNSSNLGASFNSEVVGIKFSDGSAALIAYKPNCALGDIYNPKADVTRCMVMIYDVNNSSKPNTLYYDMATINLEGDIEDENDRYTKPFKPIGVDLAECEKMYLEGIIPHNCTIEPDYYAGAMKQCLAKGMHLATMKELAEFAAQFYEDVDEIGEKQNLTNLTLNREFGLKYGITTSSGKSYRFFSSEGTGWFNRVCTREIKATSTGPWCESQCSDSSAYAMCFK